MKTRIIAAAIATAGAVLFAAPTQAQELDSDSLEISLNVEASCTVTTTALTFAPVTTMEITTAVNELTAGSVDVTCTPDTTYTIGLSAGAHETSPDDVATRQLFNDTPDVANASLSYNLFSNAGRSTVWGNTAGTNTVDDVADGTAQDHAVYGVVAGSQDVSQGDYTDSVVATVWYNEQT